MTDPLLPLMIEIDRLVARLEDEGYPTPEILDALHEYTALAEDLGYLR